MSDFLEFKPGGLNALSCPLCKSDNLHQTSSSSGVSDDRQRDDEVCINFWCEGCQEGNVRQHMHSTPDVVQLRIYHHDGVTYVEWREIKTELVPVVHR